LKVFSVQESLTSGDKCFYVLSNHTVMNLTDDFVCFLILSLSCISAAFLDGPYLQMLLLLVLFILYGCTCCHCINSCLYIYFFHTNIRKMQSPNHCFHMLLPPPLIMILSCPDVHSVYINRLLKVTVC